MPALSDYSPSHLSIFAHAKETFVPVSRMPVYAEIAAALPSTGTALSSRLREVFREALAPADANVNRDPAAADRLWAEMQEVLTTRVSPQDIGVLGENRSDARAFFNDWIRRTQERMGLDTLGDLTPADRKKALAENLQPALEPFDITVTDVQMVQVVHPMGFMTTDHVGYLSYDLKRLPESIYHSVLESMHTLEKDPDAQVKTSIWLYPLGRPELKENALAQLRYADDAIVARLAIPQPIVIPTSLRNIEPVAMQNPALVDWRLSPASFAANPAALIGEDGCETLLPGNIATDSFYFYQTVVLTNPAPWAGPPPQRSADVKIGIVNEYQMVWYPLGHSLGRILYSFPLAPAESVNLAVIDWSREDSAVRTETTKLSEHLVHDLRRDRTISETVNAALEEWQRGGSMMGGAAGSLGDKRTMGQGALTETFGLSASLGGSYSTSSGNREITANTVQKLSDNVSQASTAMRELRSTIVVRTSQAEKEAIETRTIVNYNHSHALTILYYEVLRHFRIVTQWVRRRPVILVKIDSTWLNQPITEKLEDDILELRRILEPALLDKRHVEGFNALARIVHRRKMGEPAWNPPDPGERRFRHFTFEMRTGGLFSEKDNHVDISCKMRGIDITTNTTTSVSLDRYDGDEHINPPGSFRHPHHTNTFTAKLKKIDFLEWKQILGIEIGVAPVGGSDSSVSLEFIKVTGHDVHGGSELLLDQNYEHGHMVVTKAIGLLFNPRFPPPKPAKPGIAAEIEDEAKREELFAHLRFWKAYYTRVHYLDDDPARRAAHLQEEGVLDKVENKPLDMVGEFVVYPCSDAAWAQTIENLVAARPLPAITADERLATLPTRGVFAEARLGHCNASEPLDNTRFWDWQTSPIPHLAPQIQPIEAASPKPQTTSGLAPTAFPASIINIATPPAAPDPKALENALGVLKVPDIFRDMSGRKELEDLLKKLVDGTISQDGAKDKAKEIQDKFGDDLMKSTKAETGGGSSSSAGAAAGKAGISVAEANEKLKWLIARRQNGEITEEQFKESVNDLRLLLVPKPAGGK